MFLIKILTSESVHVLVLTIKEDNVYESNNKALSRNHCCRGKAIGITYSECVSVALVIQHAKCMRRIMLSSLACTALPCFFPYYLICVTICAGLGGGRRLWELFDRKSVF